MMNKQEAIEEIKKQSMQAYDDFAIMRDTAIYIVNQINEPEKPVVPQFVADWYEKNKDDFEFNIFYYLCVAYYDNPSKLSKDVYQWFADSRNEPIQTLVNMHQFGFEVEKEKLYTVELPNPNRTDVSLVLGLYNDGKVAIFAVCTDSWKYEKRYKLTEAEIKKDFDWAWQFAKEVKK